MSRERESPNRSDPWSFDGFVRQVVGDLKWAAIGSVIGAAFGALLGLGIGVASSSTSGAIFLSGIVFHGRLPRPVPMALAVGGLVLGVVVCGFWFRAALRVRTDACPHCQYRFVPGELRPSRCAECGKPTTVN